jgi:hypothetical protein
VGRKLTDHQKAERAAQKLYQKRVEEAGPLFARLVEPPGVREVLYARRLGGARQIEHLEKLSGDRLLDSLYVTQLKGLVRPHVPPGSPGGHSYWDALSAHADAIYPPRHGMPDERQVGYWLGVLRGDRKDLVLRDGGPTPNGFRKVLVDLAWPPEGWVPPYTREQLATLFWRRCDRCRRYHAPLQADCLPALEAESPFTLTG